MEKQRERDDVTFSRYAFDKE